MTTINNDRFVIEKLSSLRDIPPRDAEKAASTRTRYLSEIKALSSKNSGAAAVSISPGQRLNEWFRNFRKTSLRKERSPMLTTLATIFAVIALAFGGAGATVYAAQDSLPNDLLYPVKLASEEFRLNIATQTQTEFQLSLQFANRRMNEIAALASNGEIIPQEIMTQLQTEYKHAFQFAAGMSDEELTPALLKLQATIRQQQQTMAGISSPENEALLLRVREMLQTQQQICDSGLTDPLMFRIRVRQQQNGDLTPPTEPPAGVAPGGSQGNQGTGTGASSGGYSGANTGTQTGTGNSGNGGETCTDCIPVQDGTGPGPGPDAGNGGGSENATPPQDGTGIGQGPNEDPGTGGNTNTDPGNDNNNQNEQEDSDNGNTNSNDSSTPGSSGSENDDPGKGKP
ncbi:MAG: hypothetical protein JW908_11470 [Anaerolineales bacterium]|nr:hypothetical protein [Anaerolineales bacterium]